ncbi:MAG: carboxypeptidase regulatory-like domain-containing protein [Sedimentisphaerales bacterium]|nr:carboxypeptidase regulatory-like domain-containing protein [Sedimentisphaerales bacterium]
MSRLASARVVLIGILLVFVSAAATAGARAQDRFDPVRCSGIVVDWQSHPVAGVEVIGGENLYDYAAGRTSWGPLARTTTGPDGRFALRVRAERENYIYVVAWKKGLAIGWQSPRFARSCQDMVVQLGKPEVLAGSVVEETGRGIGGATLRLCLKMSWMGGTPGVSFETPREWFTADTDDQGRFQFDNVPASGTADLWVEAPGKASCWTYWEHERSSIAGSQFQAGRTDIRIVLNPEAIIRGKVVDEDSGKGVPGVRLLARPDMAYANYSCVPPVVSGSDGTFVYSGLAAGEYSLQVVSPNYEAAEWVGHDTKVTVEVGQTVDVNVPVGKGGIIEVTILDATTQQPIENARAHVSQPASFGRHPCWYQSVLTNAEGVARLRVPTGQSQLRMWADAYEYFTDPDPAVVAKGQVLRREASLVPYPAVTGTVRDPSGAPAAGVIVASKPVCEEDVRTDKQGRFRVCWRPSGNIRDVLILARDPQRDLAGLAEVNDQAQAVDVALAPAFVVRGRIADPNGQPIPLATVSLWAFMPGWRTSAAPDVLTDANGLYEIRAVPAPTEDFRYRMGISAEGFGPVEQRDLPFDAAHDRQVEIQPTVLMPADKSISGVVVDANGTPVAGVPIFVTGPRGSDTAGQPRHQTSSDEQGRFAVEGVCAGPLRIQASYSSSPGGAGFLDAEGGDRDVEVILGREGVHSRLRPLLGKPLPDWKDLIDLDAEQTQGKPILVCFFDFQQRPSRNTLLQLAGQADALKQKGVIVVAVQASDVDADALSEWIEQSDITLPVGRIRTDVDATRLAWGIKSLPWLISADLNHVVRAEGFAVGDLETQIRQMGETQ